MRRSIRSGETVTEVLVRAIADQTDRDPTALRPSGEVIDSDGLDSPFTRSSGDGVESLTLVYEGCRVTVDRKAVTVEEITRPTEE